MSEQQLWEYEVHWQWGSEGYGAPLRESFTILALNDTEARGQIEKRLRRIARRYSFDCGELRHPLNPTVGGVHKKLWVSSEYVQMELGTFLQHEVEWTKQLIEQGKLFINGDYNIEPAPIAAGGAQ